MKENKIVLKSRNKYWYLLKTDVFSLFHRKRNLFMQLIKLSLLIIDMPISFCFSQENCPMDFFSKEKESVKTDSILAELSELSETWLALDLNIPFF